MTAIGLLIVMLSFPAGAIADRINDRAESRKVREAAFWTTVLCALLLIGGAATRRAIVRAAAEIGRAIP